MLFVCQRLGSEEGSGPFDVCPEAIRTWLEEMEYEVALRGAGTLPRLPASSTMVTAESPASHDGHITLDRKQAGKPIAGNRHDGFEVAGAGTQLTVRLVRHSQRKRGATDRPTLRSMAPVLDPTRLGDPVSALGFQPATDSKRRGHCAASEDDWHRNSRSLTVNSNPKGIPRGIAIVLVPRLSPSRLRVNQRYDEGFSERC
jgi:hypothetical protein